MLIKKRIIESYLPVFNGFYNTDFEPSEDHIIEEPYNFDDYDFEYDTYRIDMAKACCNAIERELKDLGISVEYQSIYSPKEYNFKTDSINVKYRLSKNSAKLLNKYLKDNIEAFTSYIHEHCTSRSGFISFFSNDVNDWFNEYTHNKLETSFGTMLDFYFENEGFTAENLYSACDHINLQSGLKTGVLETIEFVEQYAKDNYREKDNQTVVIELTQHFENEGIDYDFLSFKYIADIVNKIYADIDNLTPSLFAKAKK